MLKHIILWQLKDELTPAEKASVKRDIKEGLEGLNGKIDGLACVKVTICALDSSTADVMLETTIEESALAAYAAHPEHQRVAKEKIRPFVKSKLVMDYLVDEPVKDRR